MRIGGDDGRHTHYLPHGKDGDRHDYPVSLSHESNSTLNQDNRTYLERLGVSSRALSRTHRCSGESTSLKRRMYGNDGKRFYLMAPRCSDQCIGLAVVFGNSSIT